MKFSAKLVTGPRQLRRFLRGVWTLNRITQRIRLGFGKGELSSYKPWIYVKDLSSRGTSTRFWSVKTGRTMQFLSDVEKNFFICCEFREDFVDYWEQWPLERHWTLWAADQLGVKHPCYLGTAIDYVMTVDGVLTLARPSGVVRKAIDCKYSTAMGDLRTQEKLAIARVASDRFAYPHMVVTEQSYSPTQIANILWIRYALRRALEIEPIAGAFDMWPMRLHRSLLRNAGHPTVAATGIVAFCKEFDRNNELPGGLSLRLLKLLMWQHLVEFDMETEDPAMLTIGQLKIREQSLVGLPTPEKESAK